MEHKRLFDDYKYCEICGVPLPLTYEKSVCPACTEEKLFRDVKEYIRANDVTEYDVAYEFHIPVRKVKKWIQEGRIEYKENNANKGIMDVHCKICGKPVSFGTVCSECLKQSNSVAHASSASKTQETDSANKIGRISFLTNAHD